MHTTLHLPADAPPQTLPARSLMAFTLASHLILVPLGVALPLITLIMHGYGLRKGDPTALLLARRWSAVMAVQFAIGVVTGTVLPCSSSWRPWPRSPPPACCRVPPDPGRGSRPSRSSPPP